VFGGSRERRDEGDRAYYRLPAGDWSEVEDQTLSTLRELQLQLALVLDPAASQASRDAMPPARLAYRLFETANGLFDSVASDEQDLRQVITTLRTALAVCWDLYSIREAERTTVAQHMTGLRERIEEFERELGAIQAEREKPRSE
jgi:hypothetical protein